MAFSHSHLGSKYRAVPVVVDGVRYASTAEGRRAGELAAMRRCGAILEFIGQPRFRLGVAENVYVADFLVVYPGGRVEVEDVKGAATPKWRRDCKLWRAHGRLLLRVLRWRRARWEIELVTPAAAAAAGGGQSGVSANL